MLPFFTTRKEGRQAIHGLLIKSNYSRLIHFIIFNTMKNLIKPIGASIIMLLLFSCGNNQTPQTTAKQEVPEALQDSKFEMKSYSRGSDLTEQLYQELAENNSALKSLNEDLDAFKSKPNELKDKYYKYDGKSTDYYTAAGYKAEGIADSSLKKKIVSLITSSSKQYTGRTAELTSILEQISKNGATINDHHTVLKIVTTLAIIEKYQADNLPDKKEFKALRDQQEQLILRIDKLTPKY
jgi:hypothetical protein